MGRTTLTTPRTCFPSIRSCRASAVCSSPKKESCITRLKCSRRQRRWHKRIVNQMAHRRSASGRTTITARESLEPRSVITTKRWPSRSISIWSLAECCGRSVATQRPTSPKRRKPSITRFAHSPALPCVRLGATIYLRTVVVKGTSRIGSPSPRKASRMETSPRISPMVC